MADYLIEKNYNKNFYFSFGTWVPNKFQSTQTISFDYKLNAFLN